MTTLFSQWVLVDEPGAPPMATLKDRAWAYITEGGNQVTLEIRHCEEHQRAFIPLEVAEALFAAWRARQRSKPVTTP